MSNCIMTAVWKLVAEAIYYISYLVRTKIVSRNSWLCSVYHCSPITLFIRVFEKLVENIHTELIHCFVLIKQITNENSSEV